MDASTSATVVTEAVSRRLPVFRQAYLQAALAGLEGAHQRTDPRVERTGEHAEGKVRSRHVKQDLRGEPLFEAELLDSQGRWRSSHYSAGTYRCRCTLRGRPVADRSQLPFPTARPSGCEGRPPTGHYGVRSAEQGCH